MSIPTGSEKVRRDCEPRLPSIKARLNAIGILKYIIPCDEKHEARFSVTIAPLLPTLPEEQADFIRKLEVADLVVIQEFHSSNKLSLVASTRAEAIALKTKYSWWYDNEEKVTKSLKISWFLY